MQHHLETHGSEVWDLLCPTRGGYLYVCGDAKNMARDVHRTLHAIIVQVRGRRGFGGGGEAGGSTWSGGIADWRAAGGAAFYGPCRTAGLFCWGQGVVCMRGVAMKDLASRVLTCCGCCKWRTCTQLPFPSPPAGGDLSRGVGAVVQATGCSDQAAEAEVKRLSDSGRYLKDVW